MEEDRRLSVVGLGYVGVPLASTLAHVGFEVVGIDVDSKKVEKIQKGISPLEGIEPGLEERLREAVRSGRLSATTDFGSVRNSDAIFVCVQTPFHRERFEPDLGPLRSALESIGRNLRRGALVVVESTIAPTTMDRIVRPTLESFSGLRAGKEFDLVHCPERVTPGKLLHNLENYTRVVGGITPSSAERAARIYSRFIRAPLDLVDPLTAEIVKTAENAYRDVEIAFANELAEICEVLGADVWKVRELVNKVESRNVHLPGAGVGGHCLPKDSYLLAWSVREAFEPKILLEARRRNDRAPLLLSHIVRKEIERVRGSVQGSKATILGVSYLPGSDDVRNTPALPLLEDLEREGVEVVLHDPRVRSLGGKIVEEDLALSVSGTDAIVLVTAHPEYRKIDWKALSKIVRTRLIVDSRKGIDEDLAREAGFRVRLLGRGAAA